MKIQIIDLPINERSETIKNWLKSTGGRLGFITSIDGRQLLTLALNTETNSAAIFNTALTSKQYPSLTTEIPQAHWFERTTWDLFGLEPEGHPRLKHNLLHEEYANLLPPLSTDGFDDDFVADLSRKYKHMPVLGDGVYEISVGPIHAGIIEPGHFHFSCLGEVIFNLEIRLGYVHRGIEKKLTETHWQKQRYIVEAAASDSAAANALAHAIAIESLFDIEVSERVKFLRSLSLEIERVAMHIGDLAGLAGDVGFLGVATSLGRLRGTALGMGEQLTGSRLQRAFIRPGGVSCDTTANLELVCKKTIELRAALKPVFSSFLNNQVIHDRMENIGKIKPRLARDFGLVGVAARASNEVYDVRKHFMQGNYPDLNFAIATEENGDVLSRAKIRIKEIFSSLTLIEQMIYAMPKGRHLEKLPQQAPANKIGFGIVESHRGELIHLIFTDDAGKCKRYAIKDPSVNNWTALAISVRNNLVADFPLCNKSFSLAYSGHDL